MGNEYTNITLINEPKLSGDVADERFNKKRVELVPHIKDFVSTNERFGGTPVSITFSDKGVGSLVSIIESQHEKGVLKIPLSDSFSGGEGQFLNVWERAGVKVPYVFEEGKIHGRPYLLMEYIDAHTIGAHYSDKEILEKKIHIELGRILHTMHEPAGCGYGAVVNNSAEYDTFEKWIYGPDIEKRIKYVEENNILDEQHGYLPLVFEILTTHNSKENKSSYCHDDFGTSNIFATDPFTVFDPNPRFNNRYLDVGRSVLMIEAHRKHAEAEQFIEGYFAGEEYGARALQASIVLNAYMKIPYSHKKGRTELVKNIQEYLAQTKHLLV